MAGSIELNAFSPAAAFADALARQQVSAVELLEGFLQRVGRLDASLNSIVVKDWDRARADAANADRRLAAGDRAPLLGVPITVKESIDVAGLPSTAGVPMRVGHRAEVDAPNVSALFAAGAVVMGKTNVCTWLADYNADNPVYGRTNSPWNPQRTAGGSSGGSATLAAGLTALDLGSDLGGSIRIPPAFSGLFGHKPSHGIVTNAGHFPGSPRSNAAVPLPAQGPQARSAGDLRLAMQVLAAPEPRDAVGWRLQLPPPRNESLHGLRVAVLPVPDWIAVDPEILAAKERVVEHLGRTGAVVKAAAPAEFADFRDYYRLFRTMMSATVSIGWPDDHRGKVADFKARGADEFHSADRRGFLGTASDLCIWFGQRESYRSIWRDFFGQWDLVLAPIALIPAFTHTTVPTHERRLTIAGREFEFDYLSFFPGLATLCGLPSTVFPVGKNAGGLPIGLQVIGPFLEDRGTLHFAELMEKSYYGFSPPPGYDDALS